MHCAAKSDKSHSASGSPTIGHTIARLYTKRNEAKIDRSSTLKEAVPSQIAIEAEMLCAQGDIPTPLRDHIAQQPRTVRQSSPGSSSRGPTSRRGVAGFTEAEESARVPVDEPSSPAMPRACRPIKYPVTSPPEILTTCSCFGLGILSNAR